MKSSLRFYLTVFVTLLTVLDCQQKYHMSNEKKTQSASIKPFQYKKVYSKRDVIKIGSIEDVSLVQKVPLIFQVDNNKDHSKKSFIIDARSFDNQMSIKDQIINIVIRLKDAILTQKIENVVTGLQIEKDEWNSDKGQFESTVFGINQLTMQRHNQFYSINLPTLKKGKYKVILTTQDRNNIPSKLQIVYYLVALSDGVQTPQIIPLDTSSQNTIILPQNSILRIPVASPLQNVILQLQSCSFQQPKIFYSQQDSNPKNMLQLKDKNKQQTIFLLKNHQFPYQSRIYFKYIHSPQLYFNVQSLQEFQKGKTITQTKFNQFLLKIDKNPKHLLKRTPNLSSKFYSQISYQIKGNDLQVTYNKLYPDLKSLLKYENDLLNKIKIIYKIYVSSNQQALAKKSLCDLCSYQNGKQMVVFQKIAQEESLKDVLEKLQYENKFNKQIQKIGVYRISLWQIKKKLQKFGPQLYLNMKIYIETKNITISSGSQVPQHLEPVRNQDTFFYQPIKVDISSGSWLFFQDIKFWRLMWGIIIFMCLILFTMFFIQSLWRSWKKRMLKQVIQDRIKSPRIVISKPANQDKSLADSYGFYPSPPSSSSNIIHGYGFGNDQIIEDLQSQQKSPKKGQVIYEPLSPTYF